MSYNEYFHLTLLPTVFRYQLLHLNQKSLNITAVSDNTPSWPGFSSLCTIFQGPPPSDVEPASSGPRSQHGLGPLILQPPSNQASHS